MIRINEDQRHRFLRKVRGVLWTLRGKRLGVLGLAFKGGTDDIRESPAMLLVQELLREGCRIWAYDPAAMERAKEVLNVKRRSSPDAYQAASGADALLILTEWEEFAALDLARLRKVLKYPIVIDGRNLYDPAIMAAHGFTLLQCGPSGAADARLPAEAGGRQDRRPIPNLMKPSRALVTGGAGFLGSHLCDALLGRRLFRGRRDNLLTGRLANIEHLQNDSRFEFIEQDVCYPFDMRRRRFRVSFCQPCQPGRLRRPRHRNSAGRLATAPSKRWRSRAATTPVS